MSVHARSPSTLVHLRGLLEVSHRVRDERDLTRLVDRIAATISDSLGFATVAITLYRPVEGDFQVTTVHGNPPAREALLGTTRPASVWKPFLSGRFHRRGAYLIPHDEVDWERVPSYVPDLPLGNDPDAWHPEDALIVPMQGADGTLLGVVSVDEPESGLRPGDEELDVLVAFAEHVAAAIEAAQDAAAAARDRAALARLLDVSASLVELDSVDSVLDAVAQGIKDALGFERVAVCLLGAAGGFEPAGTAGWEPGHPGLDFEISQQELDVLFVPEFEHDGCFLIDHATAKALVGRGSKYASRRGGAGPNAWARHWLLVPLVERDGSRRGFVWVDDPADSMQPSRERLQALRTFANQATMALRAALDFETLNGRNAELAALHETAVGLLAERTALDERLRQAQKMEAIGRLAGGIAHDFNNLLTAIRGYTELSLLDLGDEEPVRANLEQIARASDRAAELTGQLLAYSRKQVLRPQVLDLNAVVAGMTPMLGRMLGPDVTFATELDPELGPTRADPTQVEQVVLNLAVNARDAMPDGGTLGIRTTNLRLEAGPHVALVVSDTGIGMDAETASQIFEPFFTTKPVGEGTGLGLATVHGIVAQSGGSISFESAPGSGTTFTVCLPCATA